MNMAPTKTADKRISPSFRLSLEIEEQVELARRRYPRRFSLITCNPIGFRKSSHVGRRPTTINNEE